MKLLFVSGGIEHSAMNLGVWSTPCAVVSVCWLFGTSVLFFLPSTAPVTLDNMNYACVVVLFFIAAGAVYWRVYARYTFEGPRRVDEDNLVHAPLGAGNSASPELSGVSSSPTDAEVSNLDGDGSPSRAGSARQSLVAVRVVDYNSATPE